jgi:3-hydroxyethyl bacteriochlorophyllide a dehydrogenase
MKAQAVVFTRANTVEFAGVDSPDPGPGDVVVRITHSWISNGTEGSFLRGERIEGDVARREGDPSPFPIVAGYQKVGVVEWVGKQIDDLAVGETVFCAMGRVNGMFSSFGGHVSPSVSPRDQIWMLPPGADPLAFSGMVLTQVGYNCGSRAPAGEGDAAAVIGDGMVGQWAAQTLALRGAVVILVGRHDDRLARFERGVTVNAARTDWVEAVRAAAGGRLAVAVDTVGSPEVVEAAIALLRHEGHVVSAGFCGTDDLISMQALRRGEKSFDSVSGWTRLRMDATRDLIASGDLQTLPLITHHFPAREAAAAWGTIRDKRENALGVILDW